jgi:hypothetical protein
LSLEEAADAIAAMGFDGADEEAFVAVAPILAGLAADRAFLGTLMVEELKDRARRQERDNDYGAQVVLLHRQDGWFLRANIWPAADDPLLRRNGAARFFYGVPHDHNFSFLTVGYWGPGYWSDAYEADDASLAGVPGEPARLRFTGRRRLEPGEMRLYRAHCDVHAQDPPDHTSISLNLVGGGGTQAFRDQYRFDLESGRIAGQLAHSATEAMLALLPDLGGPEGADLLDRFARRHPCDRIRFGAVAAQAGAAADLAAREAVLARAADDASPTVAGLARHRLAQLSAGRAWIEG